MPSSKPKHLHLVAIALFSIVAMLPAYYNGVPSGNDQGQHYQFAWTVYKSVTSGDIYPSVAGDTNHGFGDVGLRFYPPATYYVLTFFYLLLGDWYYASLVALTLVFFAGGIGVYYWAREEFGPEQALIAAAVYTFAPYHLNLIYNNALMAEFFATAVLPFCFLYVTRVCRDGRWVHTLGLAVSYSLLILTHLPMTIIASIAMVIYSLLLITKSGFMSQLIRLATSAAAALLLSSFYWSRMLPELDWVKHSSPKYFATIWNYQSNFLLYPSQIINFGEDVLSLWLADLMLVVMVLITVPTIVYLLRRREAKSRSLIAVGAVAAIAVFMTTPLSSPIWNNVVFLQKVQFPWRWLSIITVFGAVFASDGIKRASERLKTANQPLLVISLGVILVAFVFLGAFIMKGPVYISHADLNRQMATISESEGCDCWWPTWAERSAFSQKERVKTVGRAVDVGNWSATSKRFTIAAGEPTSASIAAFYYPLWHATVNETNVPVDRTTDGLISLSVSAEASDIRLAFSEPIEVKTAYTVSVVAWLFVICFWVGLKFRLSRRSPAVS